ncbi:acyl-CoA thioesterase [Candidatus Poribacteria bacterium]|nr:acyl-CoA thioesterase [Candidatus Poribacteria bacterium]
MEKNNIVKRKINIRVTYAETDQMGIVYYANYFIWFERGRNEYFRDMGLPYTELEKEKIFIPVVEANCTYKSSVKYDDLVELETWIKELKNASIIFEYEIKRGPNLIAKGHTIHAFINKEGKPIRVPEKLRSLTS